MTSYETEKEKVLIMSHEQMARLWRFALPGHKYFNKENPISKVFLRRFLNLGGMTPEMSKKIGW